MISAVDQTYHFGKTTGGSDVSSMYEAIEVTGGLFDLLPHIVVAVELENIGNEIESILIVLNVDIDARKVEAVC